MSTAGPNLPTAVTTASAGDAWSNPTNIESTSATYATAQILSGEGEVTDYLLPTTFAFSLPSGAVIDGITGTVNAALDTGSGVTASIEAGLIIGGVRQTGTTASFNVTGTTDTEYTVGSSSSKWSLTPSRTDVNGTGFGLWLQATGVTHSFYQIKVKYVELTVTYHTTVTKDVTTVASISTGTVVTKDVTSAGSVSRTVTKSVSSSAAVARAGTKSVSSSASLSRQPHADVGTAASLAFPSTDVTSVAAISAVFVTSVTTAASVGLVVTADLTTEASTSLVPTASVATAAATGITGHSPRMNGGSVSVDGLGGGYLFRR